MSSKIIGKTFQPLFGKPCWGITHDRRLNLSMNFGKPSLRVREPYETKTKSDAIREMAARRLVTLRGDWWLWLYCCYWQLISDSVLLATGSSSSRRIERAMALLTGQKLISVTVEPVTGATRFGFDLGCGLNCRRFERDSADELWTLYKPSGYALSVFGNGTCSHQRATEFEKRRQSL
jgi:hypothetical protein